jgi:hypothetical protein
MCDAAWGCAEDVIVLRGWQGNRSTYHQFVKKSMIDDAA